MAKRLLMYQIDHIKMRVSAMVSKKCDAIDEEAEAELAKIKKPKMLTGRDAAKAFNDGKFDFPLNIRTDTRSGTYKNNYTDYYVCVVDILQLSGYAKKNKAANKAYEKACDKIKPKFDKRRASAVKAGEDLVTRLVLGDAEGYQAMMDPFEHRIF